MDEVLRQFCPHGPGEVGVSVLGRGNINDTWLVSAQDRSFVLQRLNRRVFANPQLIMANLDTFSRHLRDDNKACRQRWENCTLVLTRTGASCYLDEAGDIWRALSYIEGAVTHPVITTAARAGQVGWALGHFHRLVADLPAASLHDTLPGFHVLPRYLEHFDQVLSRTAGGGGAGTKGGPELRFCLDFVAARRAGADLLERARHQGRIGVRTIHGDPKAANILFDAATDLAVSLIDLDTLGPGLLLSDIGDCLRSCCNIRGEEGGDAAAVVFDVEICRAILMGYVAGADSLLSEQEAALLFEAVRLTAFELGLRFLTDFLAGNLYFKVSHAEENLHRALVQFHLVASIEGQKRRIEEMVRDVRRCPE